MSTSPHTPLPAPPPTPSAPRRVEVLAVRNGEAWGTLSVELIGDLEPVERLGESLRHRITTKEFTRVAVAPGVSRSRWYDVEWELVTVTLDANGTRGYAYVTADDATSDLRTVERLIRAFQAELDD